ncbi:hypothetical protein SDC9_54639 [bioreactor metagenome]|uniref:DUF1285 domain-containing protein n=1 Tax=bioreactor metagenome TaxID=1076179 RepID=A0A644WXA4_9ZZZZ
MEQFHNPDFFIDKDGKWYADGVLMIKKEIIKLFASNLKKDAPNNYYIEWQGKPYPVRIEDVPFYVRSVTVDSDNVLLELYDGRKLPLPPGKSIVLKNAVPYLSLFSPCDTRLSQRSYSELCENVSERDGRYFIRFGEREWPIEEIL